MVKVAWCFTSGRQLTCSFSPPLNPNQLVDGRLGRLLDVGGELVELHVCEIFVEPFVIINSCLVQLDVFRAQSDVHLEFSWFGAAVVLYADEAVVAVGLVTAEPLVALLPSDRMIC